ncbi:hypothetical protein EVAR_46436_1 [Eumeta japonica]|uniref:Uncharacterized protein n=1 Tax=Eumeta variegata TaxID=151549 RepID=A0A4C1XH94_EUMVA|nr:hypothetical protein EVAR_46436_1 [Eumeta japonica]
MIALERNKLIWRKRADPSDLHLGRPDSGNPPTPGGRAGSAPAPPLGPRAALRGPPGNSLINILLAPRGSIRRERFRSAQDLRLSQSKRQISGVLSGHISEGLRAITYIKQNTGNTHPRSAGSSVNNFNVQRHLFEGHPRTFQNFNVVHQSTEPVGMHEPARAPTAARALKSPKK